MKIFRQSAEELKDLRAVIVTGMLIAVSMAIESQTINLGFAKINFSFLALAAIGMLYGPTVGLFAAMICDVLGYIVAPQGGFLPLYTLIAAVQGLIYGLIAYRRLGKPKALSRNPYSNLPQIIRLCIARIVDVMLINLVCNTAANYHYGFLATETTLAAAIAARVVKNIIELPFDLFLIAAVLPAVLTAYETAFTKKRNAA